MSALDEAIAKLEADIAAKENAPAATEAIKGNALVDDIVPPAQNLSNSPRINDITVPRRDPRAIHGATPDEWAHFDLILGLTADLLPVVSNPDAQISPSSKLKTLGKTPSRYDHNRHVVGIAQWTQHAATDPEAARWSQEPDYGICVQTRRVRAWDIDIDDPQRAQAIRDAIQTELGLTLPCRARDNSGKRLLVCQVAGELPKRKMVVDGGVLEFLATGQQFVAAGTHPSGVRYAWEGGLPWGIPTITVEQLEACWNALEAWFAVEGGASTGSVSPRLRGDTVALPDPVADHLHAQGLVLSEDRDGALLIACPWSAEHSQGDDGDGSTVWFPAGTNGYSTGHFKCLHAHCADRTDSAFFQAIGYVEDVLSGFDVVESESGDAEPPHFEFYAYLPTHQYIHRPTGQLYPAASVDGNLAYKIEGKRVSAWLDRYRAAQQMTWHPAYPELLRDVVVADGDLVPKPGMLAYNRYRAPVVAPSSDDASPWLKLLRRLYPVDADHLIRWFAHRIQHPGEKINHALVLGGSQGIGKDTLLEPVKRGVGPWNWADIDPKKLTGAFNPFVESVVLRINEARDLGDLDRFTFYEHSKTYIAAPPDVLMCNNKHTKEYPVFNVMGVVLTTNHKTSGIYLPPDDRRHYVAWSEACKEDSDDGYWRDLWAWLDAEGTAAVVGYLHRVDLTDFNPKAPPPKTDAFFAIVQANANPDDVALIGLVTGEDGSKLPVVTLDMLSAAAMDVGDNELFNTLTDRKNRRKVPHMMERAGYVPVRNPDAKDGLWAICGSRQVIYADSGMSIAERVRKAQVHALTGGTAG